MEDTQNETYWYGAHGELLDAVGSDGVPRDYIRLAGRVIARYDQPAGWVVYYFYNDANGSQRVMTRGDGSVLEAQDFTPFGDPRYLVATAEDNYLFAGLLFDVEDQNDSAANRRMSPTYNRWFSPDPGGTKVVNLSDPQTWNMYAYAGNNPVTFNDPSGLCPDSHQKDIAACTNAKNSARNSASVANSAHTSTPAVTGAQKQNSTQQLTNAQDAARNNPHNAPHGGTTFCNIATCQIARTMGAPMGALTNPGNGQPALANQIAANLARHGSGYRQVSPAEAQRLANQGVLVIAVQPHAGHGHVATVRPGGSANNPLINNIGAHVNVVPASRAFYRNPPVTYYTPQ